MSLKKCAPALLAVFLAAGSLAGYGVSLTDEREGLKSATARSSRALRSKLPFRR